MDAAWAKMYIYPSLQSSGCKHLWPLDCVLFYSVLFFEPTKSCVHQSMNESFEQVKIWNIYTDH